MLVRAASREQIQDIFRQVHCVWPHDPDPEEHLRRRLASHQHQRATWFAGLEGDELVASLGAYPYEIFVPGCERRKARVFGAVFTPEQQRGRGYASQLLREVMGYYEAEGVKDFFLYSDIGTSFYEKLGFVALPSYEWCLPISSDPEEDSSAQGGVLSSVPSPRSASFSSGFYRAAEFSHWIHHKQTGELSCWNPEHLAIGQEPAYLWSTCDDGTYVLLESNLSQEPEDWSLFLELVTDDARRRGAHVARGWWTAAAQQPSSEQSQVLPRDKEILMWRSSLGPQGENGKSTSFRAYLSEHV